MISLSAPRSDDDSVGGSIIHSFGRTLEFDNVFFCDNNFVCNTYLGKYYVDDD